MWFTGVAVLTGLEDSWCCSCNKAQQEQNVVNKQSSHVVPRIGCGMFCVRRCCRVLLWMMQHIGQHGMLYPNTKKLHIVEHNIGPC